MRSLSSRDNCDFRHCPLNVDAHEGGRCSFGNPILYWSPHRQRPPRHQIAAGSNAWVQTVQKRRHHSYRNRTAATDSQGSIRSQRNWSQRDNCVCHLECSAEIMIIQACVVAKSRLIAVGTRAVTLTFARDRGTCHSFRPPSSTQSRPAHPSH
jgi:hypothetical protein